MRTESSRKKPEPTPGQVLTPSEAMRLAIREGRRGTGFVSPNPLVGCVIVDSDHRLLATGYHAKLGEAHAEIAAIKKISDPKKIRGAHVYVTLEPCAHEGRTGSCAKALVPLKPASVTYAVEDPNPLVSGKGARILREVGIRAEPLSGREDIRDRWQLVDDAEDLAEIFLYNQRAGETFIAVKVASTLDGQIALASGESKWITSEKAREHAHLIRARYDAVAVGVTTLKSDDPSLNVRHPRYPDFQNKAVVFDPTGRGLASLNVPSLMRVRPEESVIVVTDRDLKIENVTGVKLLPVARRDGLFDIDEVLQGLSSLGVHSMMIEGGSQTISAFFNARKVHRLHAYLAPSLFGAKQAITWSSGFGVPSMEARIRLENSHRRVLGDDLYWSARVKF
jgi:diaminohydroxyphosphoribosylaminopyrimidine deaminase/5-amino-6-(5-phosphoribosylamino)uracil reductase